MTSLSFATFSFKELRPHFKYWSANKKAIAHRPWASRSGIYHTLSSIQSTCPPPPPPPLNICLSHPKLAKHSAFCILHLIIAHEMRSAAPSTSLENKMQDVSRYACIGNTLETGNCTYGISWWEIVTTVSQQFHNKTATLHGPQLTVQQCQLQG